MPKLADKAALKYLSIADALEDDIRSGRLAAGARLPAHRELAYALGTAPGTISRAYEEAARRGLVVGEVGRGTFVRGTSASSEVHDELVVEEASRRNVIDLGLNLSAVGKSEKLLHTTLAALGRERDLSPLLEYKPAGGMRSHRESGALWIGRWGVAAAAGQIVVCNGAQHGLLISLLSLLRQGETILTENLTYPGMRALGHQLGLEFQGLPMDEEGLRPDALDQACRTTRARVLYCMPDLHNPTTATMSEDRRREVAAIARKRDLWIIEDDVYGFLARTKRVRLASLAPDRTIYINSASKCMAPGLRVGFLRVPDALIDTVVAVARMTDWMVAPLMAEIVHRWIRDGRADQLVEWHRGQAMRRQAIARRHLDPLDYETAPRSYHLWLHLPKHWRMDVLLPELLRRGVKILPAETFCVRREVCPHAVRICLGSVTDETSLESALHVIAELLTGSQPPIMAMV